MMKPRVLIDVTLFEDLVQKTSDCKEAEKLLGRIRNGLIDGWISSLTKPLLYRLAVKEVGEGQALRTVQDLTSAFAEIPLRSSITGKAAMHPTTNYLDAIQLESARQFHLHALITTNKSGYQDADFPVYSPEEFNASCHQSEGPMSASVPFLDLRAQHHKVYNEIDDRITDVIANTAFILGRHVEEFESQFAALQGAEFCLGVSSGTDALHIAMMVLGIGPGDGVLVPVNTFIATAEAVSLVGAVPVFVDCNEFYNIDADKARDLLKKHRDFPIKAIIPVHLYGQPADMDAVMAVAEEYGLSVVEDGCQAHLAEYKGRKVGNWGAFSAFSFYPGKNLGAYGEAGALITNDVELYQAAKMLRQHGEIQRYHHRTVGHNYRMEAIQGAVLSAKVGYLPEWTKQRRANAQLLTQLLDEVEEVSTPLELGDCFSVYHLYVIQTEDRDQLQKYLWEKGIATGLHYPVPLHLQPAYASLGYRAGDFPAAERAAGRILSLPMFPELTEDQIRYVVGAIEEYFARKRGQR